MPYNPQATYIGGQLLAQGIGKFGEEIAGAIGKYQDQQKIEAYNDMLVQHAYQKGDITFDDVNKYNAMSQANKTGFATGVAANFVDDYKRQEMELRKQQIQNTIAERTFQPTEEQLALARATGNELLPTGQGRYTAVPYGGSGAQDATVVDPVNDPQTGLPVPGVGIVRKTGQPIYTGALSQGGVRIETDTKTGIPFYRDAKGNPHPVSAQAMMAGQMNQPQPPPAPAPGIVDWIRSKFGGAPSPTPAPTPYTTPTPIPQDQTPDQTPTQTSNQPGMYYDASGNLRSVDTVPRSGIPAAAPDLQAQKAIEIKQQYQAGKISREQAVQQLQALGYQ